jgi:hypothetical protein
MSIAQRVIKRSTPKKLLKPIQASVSTRSPLPQMQVAPVDSFDLDRFRRKEIVAKTAAGMDREADEEEEEEEMAAEMDSEGDFETLSSETEGPQ